jgi:hypothetical protein
LSLISIKVCDPEPLCVVRPRGVSAYDTSSIDQIIKLRLTLQEIPASILAVRTNDHIVSAISISVDDFNAIWIIPPLTVARAGVR